MINSIFESFDPNNYPERLCCGVIEHLIVSGYELPIIPVKNGGDDDSVIGFVMSFYKSSDRRSMQPIPIGALSLQILYCPFCGKKLPEIT